MSGESVSDRVYGRVESEPEKDLNREHNGGEPRDDSSPKHAVGRRPAPRIERITSSLSDIDHQIIDLLALVRMASGSQMSRLFWPTTQTGSRSSRRRLKRLTDLR